MSSVWRRAGTGSFGSGLCVAYRSDTAAFYTVSVVQHMRHNSITLRFHSGYSSKSCDSTRLTYSLTMRAVPELEALPLFRDCVRLNDGGVGVAIEVKLDTDMACQ